MEVVTVEEASQEDILRELKERQCLKKKVRRQMFTPSPSFVRNSDALCTLKDENGKFLAISPRLCLHFGVKEEDFVGKSLKEIFGEKHTDRSEAHDEYVRWCRDSFFGPEWWYNPKYQWWEGGVVSKFPIVKENDAVHTYGLIPSTLMRGGFSSEGEVKDWLNSQGYNCE